MTARQGTKTRISHHCRTRSRSQSRHPHHPAALAAISMLQQLSISFLLLDHHLDCPVELSYWARDPAGLWTAKLALVDPSDPAIPISSCPPSLTWKRGSLAFEAPVTISKRTGDR